MNLIGLDLDGTIEDSRRDMAAAVHRVRARLGLPVRADDRVLPWVNKGMEPLYRACFDDYLCEDDERLEEVRIRYEEDYLEKVAVETRLYPGMAEAVSRLFHLGRLAVITNKPERISWRLLEALEIGKYFTTVIGGDTCAKTKPDRMVLEEAALRCGFHPDRGRTVMIGDSAADIALGRGFGATTIWCAWGYAADPGEPPDLIAKSPAELPSLALDALKNST
jgi:phosphoglycolate phosphatase